MPFLAQVFGVLQKRQVCKASEIQVSSKDYCTHEAAIRSLKPQDLLDAAEEERLKMPISNPAVQAL
ncbi:hypothetical protein M422DRAFT_267033 [Sphaerobolus stellatus SS14]|uniref:Uncharacterized protein n=1 Tax=Sphaerobolus stellatus (strain SS14) TaxID=990650 RepID=A0A0C9V1M3_SPHS4|nr:hypothetical protein M422DRAFT_267033 [Sphaerobolus stellatus SS14]